MKHTISVVRLAGILCVALATPVGSIPLWAQGETTSAITGQVSDTSSEAVARATVTITHRATGLRRQVQTDESGRFAFPQRSEEHMSELQSLRHLVCRLLLEKNSKSARPLPSTPARGRLQPRSASGPPA